MACCSLLRLLFLATTAAWLLELTPTVISITRLPSRVTTASRPSQISGLRIFPTRQRAAQQARFSSVSSAPPKKISYYGGKLYINPNVYLIYYGNWTAFSRNITENFILSINQRPSPNTVSSWWGITRQYYQAVGPFGFYRRFVSPRVHLAGRTMDKYSRGTGPLTSDDVSAIIKSKLGLRFPVDDRGIYFVLTAAGVTSPGLCTDFCGYHAMLELSPSQSINYAFVSNVESCLDSCGMQQVSPNNVPGVDAMINILAHELSEAVTDPDGLGWKSTTYGENADMCAWKFGSQVLQAKNGSGMSFQYNMKGKLAVKYMIQQNWDRVQQTCVSQRLGKS